MEEIKKYINEKFNDDIINDMLDDEIYSGSWIDYEQMEDEGYDDAYEYYKEYNNGEAESEIINQITKQISKVFEIDSNTGYEIYNYLKEKYHQLSRA